MKDHKIQLIIGGDGSASREAENSKSASSLASKYEERVASALYRRI